MEYEIFASLTEASKAPTNTYFLISAPIKDYHVKGINKTVMNCTHYKIKT